MKTYEATEQAYKNGYAKGYADSTERWSKLTNAEMKWIPIGERLPKDDGKVLAIVKEDGYNRIAFVFNEGGRWWDCFYDYDGIRNVNVTHWMPLPEPPKGEHA